MKLLTVILLSCISTWSIGQNGDWLPYKSIEGEFSILTKGKFKNATFDAETGIGKIEMNSFVCPAEPKPKDIVYTVLFYDFPEGSMHSDSTDLVETFFKETVASAKDKTGGSIIYDNDIELKGYKGKQWRINYNEEKMSINSRVYLVNNRCFILNIINPNASKGGGDSNKFFNSFRLLGE